MSSRQSASLASLLAAVVVTVAGCYSGAPAPGATDVPLVTGSPEASEVLADCPNVVEVVETGPIVGGEEITEDGPLVREQQRLESDMTAVQDYVRDHPGEFASIRWENGPRVRIVVGFTGHIEEHCAAIRAILEYPDEFEIIHQSATQAQLMAAMDDIIVMVDRSFQGVGLGAGVIDVNLRADGEDLAAEVFEKYGDLVRITVGLLPYPDRFAGPAVCRTDQLNVSDAQLDLAAELNANFIRPGADFRGKVTITNTAAAPFDFQSGPSQTAAVYLPGADLPVGFFTGGMDDIGYGATIAPGGSITLDVVGGTASCDPALGWALPPGSYEVRVQVEVYTMHDNAPTEVGYVLSPPVPLTIAP
jgi:hypothetical protein